jgi:hypothetical protein
MLLSSFLHDLLTTGSVTTTGRPAHFEPNDLQAAENLLRAYYEEDSLTLPYTAPAFDGHAAVWAAGYLYHTIQLVLVRELDESVIQQWLQDFSGSTTPEITYSVDLTFRCLPDLLRLAKGLAPGDALVLHLQATARRWPLSLVDDEPAEAAPEAVILTTPTLRQLYLDRIIQARDLRRAGQPNLRPWVEVALGGHSTLLWPDFKAFTLLPA